MSTTITIRDVDPGDKFWLQREAKRLGLSMEELVRRILHERRERAQADEKPSDVFRRWFGPENGADLPPRETHRAKPSIDFSGPEFAVKGENEA